MLLDREKLKDATLYICARCDPPTLGAVKLHKVLYFSDMLRYAETGQSVTGATYKKGPLGPTCEQLRPVLRELAEEGAIEIKTVNYFGFRKREYIPLRAPSLNRISNEERELIDEMIEFVCVSNTAKTISDFSHNKAWDAVEFGQVIPYHSVFLIFPHEVSEEAMEWASGEVSEIENQRSKRNSMDNVDFAAFRSRVLEAGRV